MKGASSKVIMGAILVMVVILAIVLALVLVLLAELYCSLLLRRRQLRTTTATTTTATATANIAASDSSSQPQHLQDQSAAPQPLRTIYTPGVIRAPRSFLFPALHSKEDKADIEKQQSQLHQFFESATQEPNTTPHRIGVVSPSPPSPFISVSSPKHIEKVTLQGGASISDCNGGASGSGGGECFVYISNPIYDNDAGRPSRADTPFETPDTSPSRLETGDSSSSGGDEEDMNQSSLSSPASVLNTPPLTPMKKLPAEACSVSLRDARSLATSGSDSNSNNDGLSSSSSGSPRTSPSW